MRVLARILYEDQRGPVTGFGPHAFVCAAVAHRLGTDRWAPLGLEGRPLKGVGNLKKAIERSADYRRDGAELFVLIDGDQIGRHVGLTGAASDAEILAKLLGEPPREGVLIFILHDNTETWLEAIAQALGETPIRGTKSLDLRDRLMHRAAERTDVLERVLLDVPAVRQLVDALVLVLQRASTV